MEKKISLFLTLILVLLLGYYFLMIRGFHLRNYKPSLKGEKVILKSNFSTDRSGELILEDPEGKRISSRTIFKNESNTRLVMSKSRENALKGKYRLLFKSNKSWKNKTIGFMGYEPEIKDINFSLTKQRGIYSIQKATINYENKGDLPVFAQLVFKTANVEKETKERVGFEANRGKIHLNSEDIVGEFFGLSPGEYNVQVSIEVGRETLDKTNKTLILS